MANLAFFDIVGFEESWFFLLLCNIRFFGLLASAAAAAAAARAVVVDLGGEISDGARNGS